MKVYDEYSRGQLIQKIEFLKSENKFLKEYLRDTKEFKELNRWVEAHFGENNK